jgi:nitroreductase
MNDTVLQTIYQRRSIRNFQDKPIDNEILVELVKLAMAAPSASNSQPLEFIIITEEEKLTMIREKMRMAKFKAPAAILILGNPQKAVNAAGKLFWVQDGSAAIENMLIGAVAMGLGTCWVGIHPVPPFEREVIKMFDLPEKVHPLSFVMVGYPAEFPEARTQFSEKAVFWNQYPQEAEDCPHF